MLVLTRKVGEGVRIGEDILVRILEEKEGRIRIGIEAPREQRIFREELYSRIVQENVEASQWRPDDLRQLSKTLGDKASKK
ncbi:MAG: carbon storage regulator CsrA [Desulfovermiculus sp.]